VKIAAGAYRGVRARRFRRRKAKLDVPPAVEARVRDGIA
jgi:hypothetical protein